MLKDSKLKIYVDMDGVICTNTWGEYEKAIPIYDNIIEINRLYDEGHTIVIWTARGGTTNIDWSELNKRQLKEWGVKYHYFDLHKPTYDILIDDKAINSVKMLKSLRNRFKQR